MKILILALAMVPGCAEFSVHQVAGMPGVTVRAIAEDPVPTYTNDHPKLVTIYYADGLMKPVMAGETVGLRPDVKYHVQVTNPRRVHQ